MDPPLSDPASRRSAAEAIIAALEEARTACILPGVLAVRAGLRDELQSFVDASGLPFATMLMDKSTLEEQQAAYLGMYDGRLMDDAVRGFVESCDRILAIGTIMTDFNTGAFTAHLDPEKTIDVGHHRTRVGSKVYPNVEIKDLLAELTRRVAKRRDRPRISRFRSGRRRARAMTRLRPRRLSSLGKVPEAERYPHYRNRHVFLGAGAG